jgi:isoquinoline 1-oxidoreductase subunit beta
MELSVNGITRCIPAPPHALCSGSSARKLELTGTKYACGIGVHAEITLQNGRVQQQNLDSYRLFALHEAPEIEVVITDSGASLGGIGEAGIPPIALALCNAVLAATGQPVTRLPIRLSG